MAKKAAKKRAKPAAARTATANALYAVALERARVALEKAKTWEQGHNLVFGPGGALQGLFPTQAGRKAFGESNEWREIKRLIDRLPQADSEPALAETASGKILVRVPKSIHAELLNESRREGVSLNQLCVAKLSRPLVELN